MPPLAAPPILTDRSQSRSTGHFQPGDDDPQFSAELRLLPTCGTWPPGTALGQLPPWALFKAALISSATFEESSPFTFGSLQGSTCKAFFRFCWDSERIAVLATQRTRSVGAFGRRSASVFLAGHSVSRLRPADVLRCRADPFGNVIVSPVYCYSQEDCLTLVGHLHAQPAGSVRATTPPAPPCSGHGPGAACRTDWYFDYLSGAHRARG